MAHANVQHPIVMKPAQPLLISRHGDESDAQHAARRTVREGNLRADQPAARHRQTIGVPASRLHGRTADVTAEAMEQCLPPECWYG